MKLELPDIPAEEHTPLVESLLALDSGDSGTLLVLFGKN
jgi:hypothetical protein